MADRRALHFVFKVGNRTKTASFFRDVLGMKFLRHEEFEKGCEAACNGPYDGRWSKSMVGYGPEDNHFVVELTYNYGIGAYPMGNDFQGIWVHNKSAFARAKEAGQQLIDVRGSKVVTLTSPDGYMFHVMDQECTEDPVKQVSLGVSDITRSVNYWRDLMGMRVLHEDADSTVLTYGPEQCSLELVNLRAPVDHAKAFGRIAFACPAKQLPEIQRTMEEAGQTVLTPLLSLDTPGKATVQVVILADPDGHEICFVGDEAFQELSAFDETADKLLNDGIAADKSDEWFAKKGKTKAVA